MYKYFLLVLFVLVALPFFITFAKADTINGSVFSITKAVAPNITSPSSTLAYSITIKNISSTNAAPMVIIDTLPSGFSYLGNAKLTTVSGSQITFNPQINGQNLTWTFDGDTLQTIPPNQQIVISYQVTASSSTGEFTNRACLSQPENVCAQSTVTITTNPETGLFDNVLLSLIIGSILIFTALKLPYTQKTFEEKLIR